MIVFVLRFLRSKEIWRWREREREFEVGEVESAVGDFLSPRRRREVAGIRAWVAEERGSRRC